MQEKRFSKDFKITVEMNFDRPIQVNIKATVTDLAVAGDIISQAMIKDQVFAALLGIAVNIYCDRDPIYKEWFQRVNAGLEKFNEN